MNDPIAAKIREAYSARHLKKLQKNASKCYAELKDPVKFNEWIVSYCVEAVEELFEEYEVE